MSTPYSKDRPATEHAEHASPSATEGGLTRAETRLSAADIKHGDAALALVGETRVTLTQEDVSYLRRLSMLSLCTAADIQNDRIRRKTDKRILSILIWLYFLQILDKSVLGLGNVWGLSEDTNLGPNDYSTIASMNAIAQLAWQPFSSYLIVRVPARTLLTVLVFGWGAAQACMAASTK